MVSLVIKVLLILVIIAALAGTEGLHSLAGRAEVKFDWSGSGRGFPAHSYIVFQLSSKITSNMIALLDS